MISRRRSRQAITLVILLFITINPWWQPAASTPTRLHPYLIHMAAQQPQAQVAVIVQESGHSNQAKEQALAYGAHITRDLWMINAFAAQMNAAAAEELAGHPSVRWISPDARVEEASQVMEVAAPPVTAFQIPSGDTDCPALVNLANLANTYVRSIGADRLWKEPGMCLNGSGITVAVVDSGIHPHRDLRQRILSSTQYNTYTVGMPDRFGHGTHIAGIIGGNGVASSGMYVGVAPAVNLVSVKVSDDTRGALTSDVVAGLQWIYENRQSYDIRLVNLSLNSTLLESYHTSPLDAALEILWFNGIVVVVSVGNNGTNGIYPPANDPFLITVGAIDETGTPIPDDDVLATFSAYGETVDGFKKPELVAPGKNIVSLLSSKKSSLARDHPENLVTNCPKGRCPYFMMSGTSMSSAVTAGAIALLLQHEPWLKPDQVKYRLISTARPFASGNGAGSLDLYSAVFTQTDLTVNTGITPSQLLWTGEEQVNWDSVNWGSVSWGSVSWGSVSWGSDYWDP